VDQPEAFGRRLLLSLDARAYGSNDDRRQYAIQSALLDVLDTAAARAGLARQTWARQAAGDGELSVLPEGEAEPRVVDDLVRELGAALAFHNEDLQDYARLRLRLAIHHGVAIRAANGFAGQGIVAVSRLVDSWALRAVLQHSGADLAVILSRQVFLDTVVQRHTSLHSTDFRKVRISNKEYEEDAWIRVPGFDVQALDLPESDAMAPRPNKPTEPAEHDTTHSRPSESANSATPAGPVAVTTIVGNVDIRNGTIGNRYNK
jgi:hypothetical protein